MDQREFNRSMDSYMRDRKSKRSRAPSSSSSKGFLASMKEVFSSDEKPDVPEPQPDSVPVEAVQAVMRGESQSQPIDEDEFDEEAFVEAHRPKGFWSSVKNMIFGSYDEQELLGDEEPEVAVVERPGDVDDDVKEMLRTCVSWVNRLPAEEISRIKRSGEYDKFKDLLRKYKLLKE